MAQHRQATHEPHSTRAHLRGEKGEGKGRPEGTQCTLPPTGRNGGECDMDVGGVLGHHFLDSGRLCRGRSLLQSPRPGPLGAGTGGCLLGR